MNNKKQLGSSRESRVMEQASARSANAIVASLCESFADDPGLSWIWSQRLDRLQRLPYFFKAIVKGTLANGLVLHSSSSDAVSLWRPPGKIDPTRIEILRGLPSMMKAFGSGRERAQLMSATLKAKRPADIAYWYLQFIGVRPAAQGKGAGGDAIRAGLHFARQARSPVYVEVMNPANLDFYLHVGFKTIDEFDIPDAGPHVWAMLWQP
jgi:ribosomal protein S18 acetylase RimI-like enzyme